MLSAYEAERERTIAANNAKLRELGLEGAIAEVQQHVKAKRAVETHERKERQKRFPPPSEPTRVSKRVRAERPQYTGERIDRFGDEMDAQIERRRSGPSAEEKAAARTEAMEVARQLLEEARAKLRAERKVPTGASAQASDLRAEAIRRWGIRAGDCDTNDWEGYVASREAIPPPTSPEPLLQEHYVLATED